MTWREPSRAVGVQELRDRARGGALGQRDVAEPRRALLPRPCVQASKKLRGCAAAPGPAPRAPPRPRDGRVGEDREARAAEDLASRR